MNLLITGQAGFVGTWLRESLRNDPRHAHIVVLPAERLDLLDRAGTAAFLAAYRPDAVIHLAALSSVADAVRDPVATASVNVIGTLHLLDALEKTRFAGRFLQVGSSEQYGLVVPESLPIRESAALAPRNPYAASKVAAEMFVLERARRGVLDAVCVRPFNHSGPGQDGRFVLPALARQVAGIACGRRPPEIVAGDLDITRDFLDVRDVVAAYLLLLHQGETGGVYNVCSGQESRLADLLDTLQQLAGTRAVVKRAPALLRPAEQRRVAGDNSRLCACGWQPGHPLDQTLQGLLDTARATLEKEST